jgi:hypothetical protein
MDNVLKPEPNYLVRLPIIEKWRINQGTTLEAELTMADGKLVKARFIHPWYVRIFGCRRIAS